MHIPERDTAHTVRITIPASTSNFGSAFDAVGLALRLYLSLEVGRQASGPSRIEYEGPNAHLVPLDESNLVWRTMRLVAERSGQSLPPFSLRVQNEIPIGRGFGSSAAAILGGVVAADFLCGLRLQARDWLQLASDVEGHPDNVAPALWGGFVISMNADRVMCSRCEFPRQWTIVAVTPDFELETHAARAILPEAVPHRHAVLNVQRAAFLVAQILQGQKDGLRAAMSDYLHQPFRSALIPGFAEILGIVDREGLLGIALSGAGPTVIAVADSHEDEIGACIREIFRRHGLGAEVRLLKADHQGMTLEYLGDTPLSAPPA